MRVRQSPVCASHTHTWPARQQLTSSMPSLARHSMSCGAQRGHETDRGRCGLGPAPRHTHHEVPAQHQGHNLRLWGRVAVVVTRQVSAAPPAGPATWLAVVAWAEHAVQAEQQQHEHNAGGQAERRHPALRGSGQVCPGASRRPRLPLGPYLYRVTSPWACATPGPLGMASQSPPGLVCGGGQALRLS